MSEYCEQYFETNNDFSKALIFNPGRKALVTCVFLNDKEILTP